MSNREVFIVGAVRTPIGRGRAGGALSGTHPVSLLSQTLRGLVSVASISEAQLNRIEDVVCGCVSPIGPQGANIGRLALLKAGFPDSVPSVQLNRMCGSGQQAVHFAAQAILSGQMDLVVACGVESMSIVPIGSDSGILTSGKLDAVHDDRRKIHVDSPDFPYPLVHQGYSAELVADKYNIDRKTLDDFSARSHEKCHHAIQSGRFETQTLPIDTGKKELFKQDEGVRFPVDRKKLGKLRPIFKKGGKVTAASASQISDGSGAIMLASDAVARELGLVKRARIVATAVVGTDPVVMLDGVIPATTKVLKKANMRISEIDLFEINEAFASVVCSWMKELNIPEEKVNVNGGAIAHGHPLGATGCILMTKLLHEMELRGVRFGLQTMCIGHGMATATIIENMSARPRL